MGVFESSPEAQRRHFMQSVAKSVFACMTALLVLPVIAIVSTSPASMSLAVIL